MPSVNIQGVGTVNFPDSMSADQIQQAIERDILPKNAPSPAAWAQRVDAEKKNFDPTDPSVFPEATYGSNYLAGIGRAIKNGAIGAAQLQNDLGFGPYYLGGAPKVTRDFVDRQKGLDAPLAKNGAGVAGDLTGNVMQALPLAAVPGLNTAVGSGLVGTVLGASEPVGSSDSRTKNALVSGGASAMTPAAFGVLRGGKALVEPMYQSGREAAVGRALNRFVGDDPSVLAALKNPQQFVPGTNPTAAEVTGNAGLAMLESGATSRDPLVKQAFTQQQQGNNAARANVLRTIAGDQGQRDFYSAARDATAGDLYGRAFAETPGNGPWIKGQVTQLMQRPAFVDALKSAQEIAMNQGVKVSPDNPENATQILHYAKMALDDAATNAIASGNKNAAAGIMDTRNRLVSLMESKDFSPSYREARDTYAKMSQPINQMDVGQYLYDKLVPALNDFGGTSRTRAQAFADAMRNADTTAQKATGFPGAKMESVMTPEQMAAITNLGKDLSRRASVEDMMRGIGSNTSQNLAAQNLMGQLFGPLGLPQSWGQRLVSGISSVPWVGPAVQFGLKGAEEQLQKELARGLLSPSVAASFMERAKPKDLGPVAKGALRYLPVGRAGLLSLVTQPSQQ